MNDDIWASSNRAGIRASTEHNFEFSMSSFDLSWVTDFEDSTQERILSRYSDSPKFGRENLNYWKNKKSFLDLTDSLIV